MIYNLTIKKIKKYKNPRKIKHLNQQFIKNLNFLLPTHRHNYNKTII